MKLALQSAGVAGELGAEAAPGLGPGPGDLSDPGLHDDHPAGGEVELSDQIPHLPSLERGPDSGEGQHDENNTKHRSYKLWTTGIQDDKMYEVYLSCDTVNVIYSTKCYRDIDFLAFACLFELCWGGNQNTYQWPVDR